MDIYWLLATLSFVFGLLWGSFANVCIYRLPLKLSVVRPASFCPECSHKIRWYHNVPILSYLLLRGRCAYCRAPISPRYLVIELICGALSLGVFLTYLPSEPGPGLSLCQLAGYLYYFFFGLALVIITAVDLRHYIIPNVITIPSTAVAMLLSSFLHPCTGVTLLESALGAAIGGGIILAFIFGYRYVAKREAIGGGDFKLLMMVGAVLGIRSLPLVFFASSILGIVVGAILKVAGVKPPEPEAYQGEAVQLPHVQKSSLLKMTLPFGPFVAMAAVLYLFIGRKLMDMLTRAVLW